MKADTSITTTYYLSDLDWNELWDIYNGLGLLSKQCNHMNDSIRIQNMMSEILRITESK